MRIDVSALQIPAIKRGIQLIRKVAKTAELSGDDIPYISTLKLSELQNIIAKAYQYGSYNEMVRSAEKCQTIQFEDSQNVESEQWDAIRQRVTEALLPFGEDTYQLRDAIQMVSWYPAAEKGFVDVFEHAKAICEDCSTITVDSVDEKSNRVVLSVNSGDLRWMAAPCHTLSYTEVSDLVYVKNDIVVYYIGSDNGRHLFNVELNDNMHNHQLLPQFAVVDARDILADKFRPAVAIIRGQDGYHYTNMGLTLNHDEDAFFDSTRAIGLSETTTSWSMRLSMFGRGNQGYYWLHSKA